MEIMPKKLKCSKEISYIYLSFYHEGNKRWSDADCKPSQKKPSAQTADCQSIVLKLKDDLPGYPAQ